MSALFHICMRHCGLVAVTSCSLLCYIEFANDNK